MIEHNHHWVVVHQSNYSEYTYKLYWCEYCGCIQKEKLVDNRPIWSGSILIPTLTK